MTKKISVIAIVAFFFGLAGTAQAWTEEKKAKLEACMSDCEMSTMAYTMERYRCENECYDEYWNTDGALETEAKPETQMAYGHSGQTGSTGNAPSGGGPSSCPDQCAHHTDLVEKAFCMSNCSQGASLKRETQIASVLPGDPASACGTDAWACFNGTDDESPAIRDIGIFSVFASK